MYFGDQIWRIADATPLYACGTEPAKKLSPPKGVAIGCACGFAANVAKTRATLDRLRLFTCVIDQPILPPDTGRSWQVSSPFLSRTNGGRPASYRGGLSFYSAARFRFFR